MRHGDADFGGGAPDARLLLRPEGAAEDVTLVSLVEVFENDHASERPRESHRDEISIAEVCTGSVRW